MIVIISQSIEQIKMFGRLFCFAIEIFLYSFCRAFDGASLKKIKMLSFSQAEIHAKQKVVQT
jgi:hypothetical protein